MNAEQILMMQIGELHFQNAQLQARVSQLEKELAEFSEKEK